MDRPSANTSATVIAHQMPSRPKSAGSSSTHSVWNTSVRRKEIAAEIAPLLSAVKNDEVKMLKPAIRNENANRQKAWRVISNSSAS